MGVPVLAAMLAISVYSLITVISSTCLLVLFAVSASKTYTHLMIKLSKLPDSSSSDPLHKSLDMKISAEHVESIISSSIEGINSVLENLRSLFLFENVLDSIKFGVILYAVTFIGCMFNLLTCLILSWISLFTFPRLYVEKKDAVDGLVVKLQVQLDLMKNKMTNKMTNMTKKEEVVPAAENKTPEKEE